MSTEFRGEMLKSQRSLCVLGGSAVCFCFVTSPGKPPPMAARLEKALPSRREWCRTIRARMRQNF